MKVLELFGGIGAPRKALENIGVNVKLIDYVEILDWAVIAYNSMFSHLHKAQNVIGWNLNVDILIHGSPCQDFSIAGLGDVKNGGRSNLYTETLNIIKERLNPRPKVVVWENVKGLISKKRIEHFNHYLKSMEQMGYNNYYKVLIATDFGIPQKRERIFTVSIRKDVDNGKFSFDNLEKSQMKPLVEFLENDVDIKYYLHQKSMIKAVQLGKIKVINNNQYIANHEFNYTLHDGSPRKAFVVREKEDNIIIPIFKNHQANIINKTDTNNSRVNTITTNYNTIKIAVPLDRTQTITTKQFRWNNAGVIKVPLTNFNAENYVINAYDNNSSAPTITAGGANSRIKIALPQINKQGFENLPVFIIDGKPYHVRILTERECWRLMGFTDVDFDNVKNANVPKTGLYHLAGNSIVVQVLESIFKEIIKVLGGK